MKTRINKSTLQKAYLEPVTLLHIISFLAFFAFLYLVNTATYAYWFSSTPTLWQVYSKTAQINGTVLIVLMNIFFLVLYSRRIPFFERFKVNNLEWPWIENPARWREIWPDCVKTYIVNQFMLFPPAFMIVVYFARTNVSPETVPGILTVLWQMVFCTFLEDFFFYFGHRLLHHPALYSRIHKKHHSFYNVFHMSAVYSHWFEFVCANLIPLFAGAVLLGPKMHIVSLMVFIMFRSVETHETHSGYEFPWSPFKIFPFSTDSAYHNFHHLKNIGNYSSFMTTWDSFFGTNKYFYDSIRDGSDQEPTKAT